MSFWKDWSDGKKWIMGVLGAIVVALLLTGINRLIQDNANSRREASTATNGKNDSSNDNKPRVSFTVKQLSGDWQLDYFVVGAPYKRRARLYENLRFWIETDDIGIFCNTEYSGCDMSWKLNEDGTVHVNFAAKIRADTGRFNTADPYRSVTCNLQPDQSGSTLEGSCIDGVGKGVLRLSR
jgi:hypothetical protein